MIKTYSLRHRLVLWVSTPMLIATILTLMASFLFAYHEVGEVYDGQLVHSAKVLLQLTQHEIKQDTTLNLDVENTALKHKYEQKLGFRIWLENKIITQSVNNQNITRLESPPGFSTQNVDNRAWRFFVYENPDSKIKIEVYEKIAIRYELILQLMIALIIPVLFFIPAILIIVWVSARKVLRPVIKLSDDVDLRGSDDLTAITPDSLPEEIAPLILALNRLFKRLQDSFKREREFTDHAAHELRTPLAAMKTQTQVLIKKASHMPDDCAHGLENLESSINRATHLVEQLLSLARLQNEKLPKQRMDLSECVIDAVSEIKQNAQKKNIITQIKIEEDLFIHGHDFSIFILLKNLLDNAVKYTPENGQLEINLHKDGLLEIKDSGSGISEEMKTRVFERFVRADTSGQSGSGLGLSIAQWVAQKHNTEINLLDNQPHGLVIKIDWDIMP